MTVAVAGSEAAGRGREAEGVSRERRRGGCCGDAGVGLVVHDVGRAGGVAGLVEMVAESRQIETEKEVKSCW